MAVVFIKRTSLCVPVSHRTVVTRPAYQAVDGIRQSQCIRKKYQIIVNKIKLRGSSEWPTAFGQFMTLARLCHFTCRNRRPHNPPTSPPVHQPHPLPLTPSSTCRRTPHYAKPSEAPPWLQVSVSALNLILTFWGNI